MKNTFEMEMDNEILKQNNAGQVKDYKIKRFFFVHSKILI